MNVATFHRSLLSLLIASLVATAGIGCGSRSETPKLLSQLVPVTGKVTLDGQPLEGVLVTYLLSEAVPTGETATGLTDAQGVYSLHTYVVGYSPSESQGAVPGQYRVVIQKLIRPDGTAIPPETTDAEAEAQGARQLLPRQYSDMAATKLTAEVKGDGPNTNNFELRKKS